MKKLVASFIIFSALFFAIGSNDSCFGNNCSESTSQSLNENCQDCLQCSTTHFFENSFCFSLKDKIKINTINYQVINLTENKWHSFIFMPPIS
jgi:hypothetical protein